MRFRFDELDVVVVRTLVGRLCWVERVDARLDDILRIDERICERLIRCVFPVG